MNSLKKHFLLIFFIFSTKIFLSKSQSNEESSSTPSLSIEFSSGNILSYETMIIKIETTYEIISQGFKIAINDSSINYNNSPKYTFNSNISVIELRSKVNNGIPSLMNNFVISELSIEISPNFSNQNQTNLTNWYIFNLTNVPTPPDVGSYNFYLFLKGDETPKAFQKINFFKKIIKSAVINTSSNKCGEKNNYNIIITNLSNIIQGSKIIINFPFYNSENSFLSYLETSAENHKLIINSDSIDSTAKIIYSNENQLNIIDAFNSSAHLNIEFINITIENILNAPSLRKIKGPTIKFENPKNSVYLETQPIQIECSIPNDIIIFNGNYLNSTINTLTQLQIKFLTENFIPINAKLELILPEEITVTPNILTQIIKENNINENVKHSIDGNKITLINFMTENINNVIHSFGIDSILTPNSTKNTSEFILNIYDNDKENDSFLMYTLKEKFCMSQTASTLKNVFVELENNVINNKGYLFISFVNIDIIPKNSFIIIELPQELNIENNENVLCNKNYDYKCDINNNVITISNYFNEVFDIDKNISFFIDNVTNYDRVKPLENSIKLKIFDNENYILSQKLNDLFVNFSPSLISISVESDSKINGKLSNYLFEISITDSILENSEFIINFPPEITITEAPNNISFSIDSKENLIQINSFEIKNNNNIQIIDIKNLNPQKLTSNQKLFLFIGNNCIKNPRSFKTSSNFNIEILSNDNFLISKTSPNSNQTISNSESEKITNISIVPQSLVSGEITSYSFEFKTPLNLLPSDLIIIEFPSEISIEKYKNIISANGHGNLSYNLNIDKISINKNNNNYQIFVIININSDGGEISEGDDIKITLNNIKNPSFLTTTSNFMLKATTNESYDLFVYDKDINISITKAHSFSSVSITPEIMTINSVSDYIVEFSPFNNLMTKDKIVFQLPNEIYFDDENCFIETISNETLNENLNCVEIDNENKIYEIKDAFKFDDINNENNIKFKMKNLKNSLNSTNLKTSSFKMSTTDENGNLKDNESNNLKINFECFSPCDTCNSERPSFCLSCLLSSGTPYVLSGSCYSKCPETYVNEESTKQCLKCGEGCLTCSSDNVNHCTSCVSNFPYFLIENGTCVNKCPLNYYINSQNNCEKCSENCLTCEETSKTCTSCANNLFLFNNKCLSECPKQITIQSNENNTCINCDLNCKTCEENPSKCTSCNNPLLLYDNKCIEKSQCSKVKNLFQDNENLLCLDCQKGCKICGNSINVCEECEEGFYLIKETGKCIEKVEICAEKYFLNSNKICEECDYEKSKCLNCITTKETCTSCVSGFLLENNKCVESCSEGYFLSSNNNNKINNNNNNNNNECLKCDETCLSCSKNSKNCLSCPENLFFKDNKCLTSSECSMIESFYTNSLSKTCAKCPDQNCKICSENNSKILCLKCHQNYFELNGICVGICPDGYNSDFNSKKCIKNANYLVYNSKSNLKFKFKYHLPFDFYIIPISMMFLFIGILFQKFYKESMFFFAVLIAIFSILFKLILVGLFILTFISGEKILFYLFSFCLLLSIFLTCVFILIFFFYTFKDIEFSYWSTSNNCIIIFYTIFMFIFDYKFVRLFYSRLTYQNFFSAKFRNFNKIHKPYFILVIIDLITVQTLFTISCVFAIAIYNKNYSVLWFLALYGILICLLMMLSEIVDLIFNKNINSDFYNQKVQKPDIIPNNVNEVQLGLSQFMDNNNFNNNNNTSIDSRFDDVNINNSGNFEITNRKLKSARSNFNDEKDFNNNNNLNYSKTTNKHLMSNNINNSNIFLDNNCVNKINKKRVINLSKINQNFQNELQENINNNNNNLNLSEIDTNINHSIIVNQTLEDNINNNNNNNEINNKIIEKHITTTTIIKTTNKENIDLNNKNEIVENKKIISNNNINNDDEEDEKDINIIKENISTPPTKKDIIVNALENKYISFGQKNKSSNNNINYKINNVKLNEINEEKLDKINDFSNEFNNEENNIKYINNNNNKFKSRNISTNIFFNNSNYNSNSNLNGNNIFPNNISAISNNNNLDKSQNSFISTSTKQKKIIKSFSTISTTNNNKIKKKKNNSESTNKIN